MCFHTQTVSPQTQPVSPEVMVCVSTDTVGFTQNSRKKLIISKLLEFYATNPYIFIINSKFAKGHFSPKKKSPKPSKKITRPNPLKIPISHPIHIYNTRTHTRTHKRTPQSQKKTAVFPPEKHFYKPQNQSIKPLHINKYFNIQMLFKRITSKPHSKKKIKAEKGDVWG